MIRRSSCLTLLTAATMLFSSSSVFSQEPTKPTEEHQGLAKMEGAWDAVMKSEYGESKGSATYKMQDGGLWLASEFKMDDGSFSGHGIDGYDVTKKKFVGIWTDSVSTTPMIMEGTWDDREKSITMTGSGPGPDGKPATYKSISKHPDDDHMNFELFVKSAAGPETKMLSIEYTRRK
jgi:hypothetical protein